MRTTRSLMLMTFLLAAQARLAGAGELQPVPVDVKTVFVSYGGFMLPALWLAGQDDGWSGPLPYAADDACTARLQDISPAPLAKLDPSEHLPPRQATLPLPRPRHPGHPTPRLSSP